ncbi:hypothetical protein MMC19_006822 [Ptychographa xylographoides]|nr:hypothetical protein [Ptychographa xylographoides]
MDSSSVSKTSGIPRISKLPLPRSDRTLNKAESHHSSQLPKVTATGATQVPITRANRNSIIQAPSRPLAKNHFEKLTNSNKDDLVINQQPVAQVEAGPLQADLSDDSSNGQQLISTNDHEPQAREQARNRKARPSLSDRTTETLSQVPPSPSPRRRQSGFFIAESPMGPPSRTASALSYTRPASIAEASNIAKLPMQRLSSPKKHSGLLGNGVQLPSSTPNRRAVSTYLPQSSLDLSRSIGQSPTKSAFPGPQLPSVRSTISTTRIQGRKPVQGSKTLALKPTKPRAPLQSLFVEVDSKPSEQQEVTSNGLQNGSQNIGSSRASPRTRTKGASSLKPQAKTLKSSLPMTKIYPDDDDARKVSVSSQSLRETIAKAKAAQKVRRGPSESSMTPRSIENDAVAVMVSEVDPFSLDLTENGHINVLRKRINTARTDGRLNIAALSLTEIPKEVMNMYENDTNNTDTVAWYENVDLTRINAADNDITDLDLAFPLRSPDPLDCEDDGSPAHIFAALEVMDIRRNRLKAVPPGLQHLSRLTSLNLSGNSITSDAIVVISKINSLRELRLAENALRGPLESCICELQNLEILDINDNAISDLPKRINMLSKLKILDVASNKLVSLPFEEMAGMPLVEIVASKNRLNGTLVPSTIESFPNLQRLEVSYNALVSIMSDQVEMPSLQLFDCSNNRIVALPASLIWPKLVTLTATENQIKSLPADFIHLKDLKNADFTGNSLTNIDNGIGLMDSLVVLRLTGNPLQERKLLRMTTEQVKVEMRTRLTSPTSEVSVSGEQHPLSAGIEVSQFWSVNSGVLDKSRSKLRGLESTDLELVLKSSEVKSFVLSHNILQHVPQSITAFAATLATLDLSHNKLGQNMAYLSEPLSLPYLTTLNLTSNALTTLDPLMKYLLAPKLAMLNLSFNRLKSVPLLREAFPAILTVLASNNAIAELDVESVRGLQTLDVSSNEIEYLPPKLAILQGQLRTLMVGGNKFRVPGWGVLEKGTEEILNWCRKRIPIGEEGAITDEVD